MATGTYAPDPDLHVVDANGVPVSGGLVWTYIAGTTTPTPTYTDVGLTVANTNPIVAGSDGRFVAFLVGGNSYKFVYETPAIPPAHGAGLATRDNILAVTTIVPGTGGGIIQFTTLSGTVNDLALIPGCSILSCRNSSPLTITGLSAGVSGQRLTIWSAPSTVALAHLNSGSLAPNRLMNWVSSAPTMLASGPSFAGGAATYVYDDALGRWSLVAHEQGAWIVPPFNAADFTASGGTWTVASNNVLNSYRLSGRTLMLRIYISGTTITGSPGSLTITIPNGYTLASGAFDPFTPARVVDSGPFMGMVAVQGGPTLLSVLTGVAGSGWTAGSSRQIEFTKFFEVA